MKTILREGPPGALHIEGHVLEMLSTFVPSSVHCVVTSPPYWGCRDYGLSDEVWPPQLGQEQELLQYARRLGELGEALHRVVRDDGTMWIVIGDVKREGSCQLLPYWLATELDYVGWDLTAQVVWEKPDAMPRRALYPVPCHEWVMMFTKRGYKHYWNEWASRGKFVRSVWKIPKESYKGAHFAAYPVALAQRCIQFSVPDPGIGVCATCGAPHAPQITRDRKATRPAKTSKTAGKSKAATGLRDPERHVTTKTLERWVPTCRCCLLPTIVPTVLDPFVGSGATMVAGLRLQCNVIGIDLDSQSVEFCRERLKKEKCRGT